MSEWLAQITPDTLYEEMLDRPSSFNPDPEQMDGGGFEITRLGTPNGRNENMRYYARYNTGNIYEVEWPFYQAVAQDEAEIKHLNPKGEEPDPLTEPTIKSLDHFDHFWEPQAAALANRRLMSDGRKGFDKAFSHASNRGFFADPRSFMHYASRVFEFSLGNNMPATAYAVAKTAFTGVMTVRGQTLRCHGLRHWLDEHITHVIEPGISQALRNANSNSVEAEYRDVMRLDRLRRDVATQAIDLAQCNWVMRSLKKADEYYADKNPALTEKIVWHQVLTGRQSILTAKGLTESMDTIPEAMRGTTSLRPENQTPQQIGSYILDILN